jgi:hypothetical protein
MSDCVDTLFGLLKTFQTKCQMTRTFNYQLFIVFWYLLGVVIIIGGSLGLAHYYTIQTFSPKVAPTDPPQSPTNAVGQATEPTKV